MKPVLLYSAEKVAEIAHDLYAIDQAMKLGFGWRLGPFETWDALGFMDTIERLEAEGEAIPTWIQDMVAAGNTAFYRDNAFYHDGEYRPIEVEANVFRVTALKPHDTIFKNTGALCSILAMMSLYSSSIHRTSQLALTSSR